jgi:hypothetical protein
MWLGIMDIIPDFPMPGIPSILLLSIAIPP